MAKSTKQDIWDTLLEMLRDTPLDEITVKNLTEKCGISRQAFYYHFSDIYSAVGWGIQQELEALDSVRELETFHPGGVMERIWENRTVILNAYRAFERSYVAHYLKSWAEPLVGREVMEAAGRYRVTEDQLKFVTELYAGGMVELLLNWLDRGMPSRTIDHLDDFRAILDGLPEYALKCLENKNRGVRTAQN